MLRRQLLAGLGVTALASAFSRPASAGLPIPHAELKRCWFIAQHAADARQMLDRAPASWGGLPWSFEGPVQFHDPERLETVRVKIVAVRDHWTGGTRGSGEPGHWIHVDYEVTEPVRVRRIGTRVFFKGANVPVPVDDTEADPE